MLLNYDKKHKCPRRRRRKKVKKQKQWHVIAFLNFVVKRKKADVPTRVLKLCASVGGAGLKLRRQG